jgi:hypothetical protein
MYFCERPAASRRSEDPLTGVKAMDPISKDDLKSLVQEEDGTLLSLFMPTVKAGDEKLQEPIRLRNLIKKAWEMLPESGLRSPELAALLDPVQALLDDALFWQHQDEGLALFVSPRGMRTFRLPLPFGEQVFMSGHFHVKPLLPLFTVDGHFYLLVLDMHKTKLMYGTRHGLSEMSLGNTPVNMNDALHLDDASIRHELGIHPGPSGAVGSKPSGYHGHGVGSTDYKKEEIQLFFQKVADGVHSVLRAENAPLVLAGVDYLLPIYHGANRYPYLLEGGITKKVETMHSPALHERALSLVEPLFNREEEEARLRCGWLAGVQSALVSSDVREIVTAAYTGRVDTLFVALDACRWGFFEPGALRIELLDEPATGAVDLLDTAAVWALQSRSSIYAVNREKVPGGAEATALFRYEV